MKIAHFSDVHWLGTDRHKEYKEVFELFFKSITEKQVDAIVLTGDIFHSKTHNITPEVIENIVWMFNSLKQIAPVYVTLGNHDGNLKNETRQDLISPLLEAINSDKIFLMKKSGNYNLSVNNVTKANLAVFSCFDKENWQKCYPKNNKLPNIALFHGSVNGCVVGENYLLQDPEVEMDLFEGYDFGLLGDIHKQQFLGTRKDKNNITKPWIGYAGSLIQQNFGEEKEKGYLLWDIINKDEWDVEYVIIPNKYQFITLNWQGNLDSTFLNLVPAEILQSDEFTTNPTNLLKNLLEDKRVKIKSDKKISAIEKRQINLKLGELNASYSVVDDGDATKISTVEAGNVSVHKTSLRNDQNVLPALYEEYLGTNLKNHGLSEEEVKKGKELIKNYLKKIVESDTDSQVRDVIWSLKNLKFSNLYKYDEDNAINFEKLNGIVSISGNNRIGKSSIIGAITYALFNTTDRGPVKSFHVVNNKKKKAEAEVIFSINENDYVAIRSTEKKGKPEDEKASTTLDFYKVEGKEKIEITNKNDDSRTDTDKVIRKYIGTSQDFVLTSFANRTSLDNFIEQGATQRKEIINKFLDLDIFNLLYKLSNTDLTGIKARTAVYSNTDIDSAIKKLQEQKQETENSVNLILSMELENLKKEKESYSEDNKKFTEIQKSIELKNKLISDCKTISENLNIARTKLQDRKTSLEKAKTEIEDTKNIISLHNIEELNLKKKKIKEITEKYNKQKNQLMLENAKIETQKKSVKKLDLIPCGTSYPTCEFIKDSHENNKLLPAQEQLVKDLVLSFKSVEDMLKGLLQEEVEKKLDQANSASIKLQALLNTIPEKESVITQATEWITEKEKLLATKQKELENISLFVENHQEDIKIKNILVTLEEKIKVTEQKLRQGYIEIGSLTTKIEQLEKEKEEIKNLIQQQKILETVNSAFHKNGIPSLILKSQLPQLNEEINSILSNVVDFKVSIVTETNSNTLEIYIEDKLPSRVIEVCSGMEKTLVSLAMRVALYNLTSLPKSDMFIIDEGFGALDPVSIEKCMEFIKNLKNKFRLVLVIAHQPQVKEIADTILEINAKGLHSHVERV